ESRIAFRHARGLRQILRFASAWIELQDFAMRAEHDPVAVCRKIGPLNRACRIHGPRFQLRSIRADANVEHSRLAITRIVDVYMPIAYESDHSAARGSPADAVLFVRS